MLSAPPDWLSKLSGVTSPIRQVTIDGSSYQFGTVCVPHDCGSNTAGIMFTRNQDRIIAVVKLAGKNDSPTTLTVGQMTAREIACIQQFTDAHEASVCK